MTLSAPVAIGAATVSPAATSIVLTTTANAPAGNPIIVLLTEHVATAASALVDSAGNTYTRVDLDNQGGQKELWWTPNTLGLASGGTITATMTSTRANMLAAHVPGLSGGSFASGATALAGTFTAPSTTPPSVNSAALSSGVEKLLIGWVELNTGAVDSEITDNNGWTEIDNGANSAPWHLHWAYKIIDASTTAAQTYAPTLSTTRNWVTNIAAFDAPSGGGGGSAPRNLLLLGVG